MAVDPVCGKTVDEGAQSAAVGRVTAGAPETDPAAGTRYRYKNQWYFFCSLECRQAFIARPDEILQREASHGG